MTNIGRIRGESEGVSFEIRYPEDASLARKQVTSSSDSDRSNRCAGSSACYMSLLRKLPGLPITYEAESNGALPYGRALRCMGRITGEVLKTK